jgi:hypothetical protein
MPATPNIDLDVRNFASSDPGWHNVTVNNQPYSYCYTGGDDGHGGLEMTVGQGRDTANVQLVADHRYEISNCTFTGDGQAQLTWNGNSGRAGAIVDSNTAVETAEYTILVVDTLNGNCTISCDPEVKNKPPA